MIEPIKEKKKFDINELVSKMPKEYKIVEEFRGNVGIEEW